MNIYIVGPMGSGKSTVGKIVARSLFLDFLDSDEEIEKNTDLKLKDRIIYRGKSTILFPPSKKQKQESDIHIDSNNPEIFMDNILYYVNDSDGDTILYENDRKTVIERITPKAGRFLYFDGNIPHCASRPVESLKRLVININLSKQ